MAKSPGHPSLTSLNAVIEHVDAIDMQRQEAHSRLRKDHEALVIRVDANYEFARSRLELMAAELKTLANDMQHVTTAPISLDKLMFTPRVVGMMFAWLVATMITVVTSIMLVTSGIRSEQAAFRTDQAGLKSDIRDIRTLMDAAKTAMEAREKLRDVEGVSLRNDMADVKRLQQLQQYDIQNLKGLISSKAR